MKGCFRILANVGLIVLSVILAIESVALCDRALEPFVTAKLWPGSMGLIFEPGTEEEFDMRDYSCSVRINSLGFRDRETPLRKTCTYRVLAVGDSFTYGWGVNLEDTWCKRLERNLREQGMDIEILNLGKPAAGPDDYAEIVESAVPVLKPDLVLVGVLAGDDLQQLDLLSAKKTLRAHFPNLQHLAGYLWHRDSYKGERPPPKRSAADSRAMYVSTAKDILQKMSPEARARFDRIEPPVKQAFYDGLLNPWMIGHSTGYPDYFMNTVSMDSLGLSIRLMAHALGRVKNVANRYGADVVVFSIPEGFYVNKEAFKNVQRIGFQVVPEMQTGNVADEAVHKACERKGIRFHAVTDGFREKTDASGLYFEMDRHMSAAGNALYADLATPLLAADIGDAAKSKR